LADKQLLLGTELARRNLSMKRFKHKSQ